MRKALPGLFLLLSSIAFGQTVSYTQSVSFACNHETCNGLPLDEGGTWQFILGNQTFSINSNGFYIYGNPGNPGSGGITNVGDAFPEAPQYGGNGSEGTLTFNWKAVNSDRSLHYTGHASVTGHEVRHCLRSGCFDQIVVDSAQIYIDSVVK